MSLLAGLIHHPVVERLGWLLLHSLWLGALIGGMHEAVRFALRRQSARLRYLAGCLAMIAIMIAPLATLWFGPHEGIGAGSLGNLGFSEMHNYANASTGPVVGGPSAAGAPLMAWLTGIAPWLAVLWFVGVVVFSGRLTRSWWWAGRIRTKQNAPVPEALLETLQALCGRLGIDRSVQLLTSALVEVPTVVGWFKPVILLPAATLAGLTPRQLEAILIHELAHVRRFDYLVNSIQCVVETLMFYHPAVWWISRSVREEREHCCDDVVVEVFGDSIGYARALATLESARASNPGFALAASGGPLLNRVQRLLRFSGERPASPRQVCGLVLLGIGLLVAVAGLLWSIQPNQYVSSVRFKLVCSDNAILRSLGEYGYAQTQIGTVRSDPVLDGIVEALGLAGKWNVSKAEALERLRQNTELKLLPGTSLVDVRVLAGSPEEAAGIAGQLPLTYQLVRMKEIRDIFLEIIQRGQRTKRDHDEQCMAAQKAVDDLQERLESTLKESESEYAETAKLRNAYDRAKEHLEEVQQFNMALGMKIATLQTEMVLPSGNTQIVEPPTTDPNSIYPNRTVAIGLTAVGLLASLAGMILMKSQVDLRRAA